MGIKWFLTWCIIFPLFKILTGIKIQGRLPKQRPLIIAANHTSYLDPPTIGIAAFHEVYFLAKPGLFQLSRFFTWLIKTYNALSLEGTEGLRMAIQLLRQGKIVVIFPEGTRSLNGQLLPFNPGIGYLSISQHVPVVPAYIANSNKPFISLVLRINRLKIKFGRQIYPSGYKKNKQDYEKFTQKIRQEVLRLK